MQNSSINPKTAPRIGVLIPCFNQGSYAAESVGSALAQTLPVETIVLIDDASTDSCSAELCDTLRSDKVQVIKLEQNLGRALVRNRALAELTDVDFVAVLDCDDIMHPEYLQKVVTTMLTDESIGVGYGVLHHFDDGAGLPDLAMSKKTWPKNHWNKEHMYLENQIPGPGAVFRYSALQKTQGWRKEFTNCSGEDFDIALQVIEAGFRPEWVVDAAFFYRQHTNSFLANNTELRRCEMEIAILRLHLPGVRKLHSTRTFVSRRLIPTLLKAIRDLDWSAMKRLVVPLLGIAPISTMQALSSHYLNQAKSRFIRDRSAQNPF